MVRRKKVKNGLFNKTSGEEDEVPLTPRKSAAHLQEVRELAKDFNQRRSLLGIPQSQAAQALNVYNEPTYNELALARLERLDITPRSAAKMRPALKRFLEDTEIKFSDRYKILSSSFGIYFI